MVAINHFGRTADATASPHTQHSECDVAFATALFPKVEDELHRGRRERDPHRGLLRAGSQQEYSRQGGCRSSGAIPGWLLLAPARGRRARGG